MIKGDDFVVQANIAIFRTLNHDLEFKTKWGGGKIIIWL